MVKKTLEVLLCFAGKLRLAERLIVRNQLNQALLLLFESSNLPLMFSNGVVDRLDQRSVLLNQIVDRLSGLFSGSQIAAIVIDGGVHDSNLPPRMEAKLSHTPTV